MKEVRVEKKRSSQKRKWLDREKKDRLLVYLGIRRPEMLACEQSVPGASKRKRAKKRLQEKEKEHKDSAPLKRCDLKQKLSVGWEGYGTESTEARWMPCKSV